MLTELKRKPNVNKFTAFVCIHTEIEHTQSKISEGKILLRLTYKTSD